MKKLFALLIGMTAMFSLSAAGVAGAAPSATSNTGVTPQGTIYKEVPKGVDLSLNVEVMPGPGETTLKPMINATTQLPELSFNPDPKMPVCTEITEANSNFPPATAISMCPNSVIGEGVSDLYLAQQVAALITDPVITVFNGGANNQGGGIMAIHAYSAFTNHGIFMSGELKNGELSVDIPRLTADSSVPSYTYDIPGVAGQTKDYVQATCKTGTWTTSAEITLGKRNEQGQVSDEEVLDTPEQNQACTGAAGKPKLKVTKVKAKGKVKANKKGTFKVTVKNSGTATAKKVKLTGKGAASGSSGVGNLAPGKTKTYTKKFKVKGKKGKKVTVKVQAKGSNSNASTGKTKVKLK